MGNDGAAVVTAIATAFIAAFALFALIGSAWTVILFRNQLREMEAARKSTLLPYLVLTLPPPRSDDQLSINAHVKNVGAGPALKVTLRLWWLPTDRADWSAGGRQPESEPGAFLFSKVEELTSQSKREALAPNWIVKMEGMAAGDENESLLKFSPSDTTGLVLGAVRYSFDFEDVFGTLFHYEGGQFEMVGSARE